MALRAGLTISFGDNRSFDETGRAQGRLSIEPQWSEYEGFKLGSSLRVEVPLPNTRIAFSAIVGRHQCGRL